MSERWKILNKYSIPDPLDDDLRAIFNGSTNPYMLLGAGIGVEGQLLDSKLIDGSSTSEQIMKMHDDYIQCLCGYIHHIANKFRQSHPDIKNRDAELKTEVRGYLIAIREFYRFCYLQEGG